MGCTESTTRIIKSTTHKEQGKEIKLWLQPPQNSVEDSLGAVT